MSEEIQRGHWDCYLRHFLYHNAAELPYSVVFPPMGGFMEHETGCTTNLSITRIPHLFNVSPHQEGTRPMGREHVRRQYLHFQRTSKGGVTNLIRFPDARGMEVENWFNQEYVYWYSQWEHTSWQHECSDEFFQLMGSTPMQPREAVPLSVGPIYKHRFHNGDDVIGYKSPWNDWLLPASATSTQASIVQHGF